MSAYLSRCRKLGSRLLPGGAPLRNSSSKLSFSRHPDSQFRMGFHARPSMLHLHLHLISQVLLLDHFSSLDASIFWSGLWLGRSQDQAPLEQLHNKVLPSGWRCDPRAERIWKSRKERWACSLSWSAPLLSQMHVQSKEHARVEEAHCKMWRKTHLWFCRKLWQSVILQSKNNWCWLTLPLSQQCKLQSTNRPEMPSES